MIPILLLNIFSTNGPESICLVCMNEYQSRMHKSEFKCNFTVQAAQMGTPNSSSYLVSHC